MNSENHHFLKSIQINELVLNQDQQHTVMPIRITLLFILFFSIANSLTAQGDYYQITRPKKGIMQGMDTLIEPTYDETRIDFATETAYARMNRRYRFYNLKERHWFEHPVMDSIQQIYEYSQIPYPRTLYLVRSEIQWGLMEVTSKGINMLLPASYDSIIQLSNNQLLFRVHSSQLSGIYDMKEGCFHVPLNQYERIVEIENTDLTRRLGKSYLIQLGGLFGITSNKSKILEEKYQKINWSDDLIYSQYPNGKGEVLFYQTSSPLMISNVHDLLTYKNTYALKTVKWEIYLSNGSKIEGLQDLDTVYQYYPLDDAIFHLFEDLGAEYTFVFAGRNDSLIIKELQKDQIQFIQNCQFVQQHRYGIAIKQQGKVGLVDLSFRTVIPFEYDDIMFFAKKGRKKFYMTRQHKHWSFFEDSTKLWEFDADTIFYYNLQNGLIILKQADKFALFNINNGKSSGFDYDYIFQAYSEQSYLGRIGKEYYKLLDEKTSIKTNYTFESEGYKSLEELQIALCEALNSGDSLKIRDFARKISVDWNSYEAFASVKGESRGIFSQFSNDKILQETTFHQKEINRVFSEYDKSYSQMTCRGFDEPNYQNAFALGKLQIQGVNTHFVFEMGDKTLKLSLGEIYLVNGFYKCMGSFKLNRFH